MTDIIAIFLLSMGISIFLTPKVIQLAKKYNLTDIPSGGRKIHTTPIPRIGGVAISLSFYLSFIPMIYISASFSDIIIPDSRLIYLFVGGIVTFGVGLWDDIDSLPPLLKLVFHIFAALIVFIGDIRITHVGFPGMLDWHLGWFSLPVTIFWIILVINAINLIDGLDGLAAGISFFVCLVLIILCIIGEKLIIALLLAALAGSILGFLRYNFNPASIFMGDSGSYFLGYMLATLSMLGTIKSQAAVSIMIPIIALGLPLMDALWAPVRRFALGKKIFQPDKDHFHHKLLKLGLTHKNAVMTLYGITVFMGILSVVCVYIRNERVAIVLILIGMAVIFGIRKLGYLEYLAMDKIYGWLKDVTDEAGITRDRRSFLNLQMEIEQSKNTDELWDNICKALERLKFDMSEMHLDGNFKREDSETGKVCIEDFAHYTEFVWTRNGFDRNKDVCNDCLMKLELPLLNNGSKTLGTFWLIKDLRQDLISHYRLRRVEHLRRTVMETLKRIQTDKNSEVLKP